MALTLSTLTVAKKWDDHHLDGHSVVYLFVDPHARDEFFAIVYAVTGPCEVYMGNRGYMEPVSEDEFTVTVEPGDDEGLDISLGFSTGDVQYEDEDIDGSTTHLYNPVTSQLWERVESRDYTVKIGAASDGTKMMRLEPKS